MKASSWRYSITLGIFKGRNAYEIDKIVVTSLRPTSATISNIKIDKEGLADETEVHNGVHRDGHVARDVREQGGSLPAVIRHLIFTF